MKQLFTKISELLNQDQSLMLVTVIAGHGSTPRGAGARMVVKEDGTTFGTIGGGAVEYQSGLIAVEALKEKRSFTKGFKLTKEQAAGLGMICGGNVTVYFQYADSRDRKFLNFCERVLEACNQDESSWLITDITDETAWSMGIYTERGGIVEAGDDSAEHDSGKAEPSAMAELSADRASAFTKKPGIITTEHHTYYCEPLVQAGKVYIFGGGHVSLELVPVLAHLGFPCVVLDDREEFANPARFPDAVGTVLSDFENISSQITITDQDYLVIMTRGHQYDYLIQRQALGTPARYIGVMGSRNKIKIISEKLRADGFDETEFKRFSTPIGLPILAETPAEIAVSIAAELIRERAVTVQTQANANER